MTTLLNLHDEIPDAGEMKLADNLRALAFRIVSEHPVAASHLTLAAGCIAPTSKTDLNIAKHVWGEVLEFSNQLSFLHGKARRAGQLDGRLTTEGIDVRGLEKSWAYIFDEQAAK